MNSIATTYPHPAVLPGSGLGTGWWGSIRTVLQRLPSSAGGRPARNPVEEAAAVRAMADGIRVSDPRFAADLYAAADRHEALFAGEGAR
jgi:hypothetical protein